MADAGCRYAIVGHSERRRLFGEDGPMLAKKLARAAARPELTPIYCLGETAEERDAGLTASGLRAPGRRRSGGPPAAPLVVAYEPVWAIGTGRAATPADAEAARVHLASLSVRATFRAHPLRGVRDARERRQPRLRDPDGRVSDRRREPVGFEFCEHRPCLDAPRLAA